MNYSLLKKALILLFVFFLLGYNSNAQTSNASPYCTPSGLNWGGGFDMSIPYIYLGGLELVNNFVIEDGTIVGINYDFQGYQYENQWGSIGIQKNTGYTIEIWGGFYGPTMNYYPNSFKVYVDLDQDGEFDESEAIYTDNPASGSYSTLGTLVIPASAKAGLTRMRVMADYYANYAFMQPCDGDQGFALTYGEIRDFQLNIAKYIDASITEIVRPTNPLAVGTNEVWVELANYGSANLTSCTIDWSIDGVEQSPFNWTGNLATNSTVLVNVGSYNFTAKQPLGSYEIDASVSNANGIAEDDDTANDIAPTYYVNPSISPGTYVVGGASGYHFATIQAAIIYLNSSGVQGFGDVNFQVRSGTYSGNMTIEGINDNPINIYPESGATVNIDASISDLAENYILKISNSSNISVTGINFSITGESIGGRIIQLENGTYDIDINNCTFNGVQNAPRTWDYALIYGFQNAASNLLFNNNKFNFGSTGILIHDFIGEEGIVNNNVLVNSNQFNNFTIAGVQIANTSSVNINANNFNVTNLISTKPGMAIETYNSSIIENNTISGLSGNGDSYAITTIHDMGDSDAIIRTNSITGCTNVGGILVEGVPFGSIENNTISLINSGSYETLSGINVIESGDYLMFSINNNKVNVEKCFGISTDLAHVEIYKNDVRSDGNTTNLNTAVVSLTNNSSGIVALNQISGGSIDGIYANNFFGDFYYNSIGVSTNFNRAAFKANNFEGNAMRNQFVNQSSGYSFNIMNLGSYSVLEENNYYSTNGDLGLFNGSNVASINNLQNFTGNDQNSASVDPMFKAPNDLHLSLFNEALYSTEMLSIEWSESDRQRYEKFSWDGRDRDAMGVYYFGIDNIKPEVTIVNHTKELIVCEGSVEEILGVVAYADFGAEPTFQWQYDGKDILGATSSFLYLRDLSYDMSGLYRCKVSAPGVPDDIYTKPIAVYVLTEPEITMQPNLNNVSSVGAFLKLEVDAHYRGINKEDYKGQKIYQYDFQWYKWNSNLNRGVELKDDMVISGSQSSVLTFNGLRASDATTGDDFYYVVITGMCSSVTSNNIKISTNAGIAISAQPTDTEVCEQETATFSVEANGENGVETIKYSWYFNGELIEDNDVYSGANTNELTINNSEVDLAGNYRCKLSGEPGNVSIWSNEVMLNVLQGPSLVEIPNYYYDAEIGSTLSIEVNVEGSSPLLFIWTKDGNSVLDGENENVLTIEDIKAEDAGEYYLTVSNDCRMMALAQPFVINVMDGGISSVVERKDGLALYQPNPNPVSGIATIQFESHIISKANLRLYNSLGVEIAEIYNGISQFGLNSFDFNFSNLPSGVYYYTLTIDNKVLTQKMIINK